jgi:hypothetical protein
VLLVRDVLDEPVQALDHTPLGRVDGVVAEVRAAAPPRLLGIEMGAVVLARRLPWSGEGLARFVRRCGAAAPFRIPWSRVQKIELGVTVDIDPDTTPGMAVEHWLRDRVLRWIPGA